MSATQIGRDNRSNVVPVDTDIPVDKVFLVSIVTGCGGRSFPASVSRLEAVLEKI